MIKENIKFLFFCLCLSTILIKKNFFRFILRKYINDIDISIIIPIFNSERYLISCLKSVTEQSLNNIEIICVDNGSDDNSTQILKDVQKKDNRLIIINQKNKGAASARNHGIKVSKGKFVSFMDSDDLYSNNFILEFMFDNAIKNKALICGGGLLSFTEENNQINILKIETNFSKNEFIKFSNYQYPSYFTRFIYKTNFLKKKKLYFPNYLRYEDPPFFIKSMITAQKFYSLSNITYFRRVYKKEIITNERILIDIFKGIKDCLDISKSHNLYSLYYIILDIFYSQDLINNTKMYRKSEKLKFLISKIINNISSKVIKMGNYNFNYQSIF